MARFAGFPLGPAIAIALLALVCVVTLFALAGDRSEPDLVVISPHSETTRTEIGIAFSRWHQEKFGKAITISWIDLGGTSTSEKAVTSRFEQSPDGIGIDLFFGGGTELFTSLAQEGHLIPYLPAKETLAQIPLSLGGEPVRDPQGRWHGVVLSSFGMVFNREVARRYSFPTPTHWDDLGDPRLFGWTTGADPRRSGSVGKIFSIILQAYGWERGMDVIVRYAGNARGFTEASSSIAKDVTFGDAVLGVVIDSYGYAKVAETGGRVQFILPDGQSPITADPVGILKGARNLQTARRFVDFLLSKEGQLIWMLPAGTRGGPEKHTIMRMPVRRDVYDHPRQALPIDPHEQTIRFVPKLQRPIEMKVLRAYLGAVLIDARDELVEAWKAIKDLGPQSAAWRELTRPQVSESEIHAITLEQWQHDPAFRRQTSQRWAGEARAKYRRALALAKERR